MKKLLYLVITVLEVINTIIKEITMDNIWNNNKNEVLTNVDIYIFIKKNTNII